MIPTLNNGAGTKVIGVGGGGVNTVDRMIQDGLVGIEFIAISTDDQSPVKSEAETKLDIDREVSRGLGAGTDPAAGRRATEENGEVIGAALENVDVVSVTAGEGSGTGAGAVPVVAEIARSIDALTMGAVTQPFGFEGRQRASNATVGLAELRKAIDTLIVIPNDRLLEIAGDNLTAPEAYHFVDEALCNGVERISDLTIIPGLASLNLANVKAIMEDAGTAFMGIGEATDDDGAMHTAEAAISSPLLEASIDGAYGVLLSFQPGENFSLQEMNQASKLVQEVADLSASIIFGRIIDDPLGDVVYVTIIAMGFDELEDEQFMSALRPAQAPPMRSHTFEDPAPSHHAEEPIIQPVSTNQHHYIAIPSHPIVEPATRISSTPAQSTPPVVEEPMTRSSRGLDIPASLFEDQ